MNDNLHSSNDRNNLKVGVSSGENANLQATRDNPLDPGDRNPGDGGGPLPCGYGYAFTKSGRMFFLDHNNHTTSWKDPRGDWKANQSSVPPDGSKKNPATVPVAPRDPPSAPKPFSLPISKSPAPSGAGASPPRTVCQAFFKGLCPLGDSCLFAHQRESPKELSEENPLEIGEPSIDFFEVNAKLVGEDQHVEKKNLNSAAKEWRFAKGLEDFEVNDEIMVASSLESNESYRPKQREYCGTYGVVQEILTKGYFIKVRHRDGTTFSWQSDDLMVSRPPSKPSSSSQEQRKRKNDWPINPSRPSHDIKKSNFISSSTSPPLKRSRPV